jgi:hypothetical protein
LSEELAKLYADIEGRPTRFRSPFKTVFFCGGEMRDAGDRGPAKSLRDYLCRTRSIKLKASIVFAESANKLYRDTNYDDLISFEEDIARIASIVLVIAEGPGSLAELGAFSMNETIRSSLRVISQSKYEDAESFIRYGPIEKVIQENEEYVAFYPWLTNNQGKFVRNSASPHYKPIKEFLVSNIDDIPDTAIFDQEYDVKKFFVVYWCLYLAYAASLNVLLGAVKRIYPDMTLSDLKDILYCLKIVGWCDRQKYSNKDYYFALGDGDPLIYRFPAALADKDIVARRLRVRRDFETVEKIPDHVKKTVAERRQRS